MFGLVENICIGARYSHFISFIAFFLRFGAVEVSPNLGSGPERISFSCTLKIEGTRFVSGAIITSPVQKFLVPLIHKDQMPPMDTESEEFYHHYSSFKAILLCSALAYLTSTTLSYIKISAHKAPLAVTYLPDASQ